MTKLIPKGQNAFANGIQYIGNKVWDGTKWVASQINKHGNTKYDDSYERYKKTNLGYGYGSLRSMEIENKAKAWYGEHHPEDKLPRTANPFNKQYIEWVRRAREAYSKDLWNGEAGKRWREGVHRNGSPAQTAAKIALLGSVVEAIPVTGTKLVGGIMGAPDKIYDWAAAIDEPKPSNFAHVGTNYLEKVAEVIPGKADDYIAKGLNLIGNADDAASSKDFNLFGWMNSMEY